MKSKLLLLILTAGSCSFTKVADRAGDFPLLLLITTQLTPRLAGNPDLLMAHSASGGTAGSLYTVENNQAGPEGSGFLKSEIIDEISRSDSYISIRLTTTINHFGRTCRTILVKRTDLTTTCLDQTPRCPGGQDVCPGKPIQSDETGRIVSMIDSNGNVLMVRPGTDPASVTQLAAGATAFAMSKSGYTMVRLANNSFQIFHPDGGSILAFQNAAVTCMFGGLEDTFYVQIGQDIRKLSYGAPAPGTVWTGAPNFACGSVVQAEGIVGIIYDRTVTDGTRVHFPLATEAGQAGILSYVDPATHIAINGSAGTLAFAGPGNPSFGTPLGRVIAMGSQQQIIVADDLQAFEIARDGTMFYSVSWPIDGTIVGFVPAGSSTHTTLLQHEHLRVSSMASPK
ncbi:MAG: hypothetical protein K8S54_21045 [Spirochaetia bacterium]|nr:hypothetical protein [Spirochaetia bacterium]